MKVSDGLWKVSDCFGKLSDGLRKVSDCIQQVSNGLGKVWDGLGKGEMVLEMFQIVSGRCQMVLRRC